METVYIYEDGTAADAAAAVGDAIGVPLELHDSSFYGGDYYRANRDLDEVIVLENYMEDDGEPFFKTQPVGTVCVQVIGFADAGPRLAQVRGLRAANAFLRGTPGIGPGSESGS